MTTDSAEVTQRATPGVGFAFLASLMLGLVGGAAFGALDVALNARGSPLINPIHVVFVGSLLGGFVALPVGLLTALGVKVIRRPITREQLVAVLVSLLLQALMVASLRMTVAIILLPLPLILILRTPEWMAQGIKRLDRLAVLCLALFLAIVLLAGVYSLKQALQLSRLATVVITLGALAAVWFVQRGAERNSRLTIGLLCLMIGAILLLSLGIPLKAPVANKALAAKGRTGQPNVVLIVMDTTRADHLGVYGHLGRLTPNLDRLAAESTLYENAISPSPWTVPSHASLFTGYYPLTHGATSEHHHWLDDGFVTLAEMLKKDGYQTVSLLSNISVARSNLNQGFDHQVMLYDSYERLKLYQFAQRVGLPSKWVDKGAGEALDALELWFRKAYDPQRPFFVFVNLMEAHERYLAPLTHRAAHLPRGIGYWEATRLAEGFAPLEWQVRGPQNTRVQEIIASLYAAGVAYQDEQLGKLFQIIRTYVDPDETVVIVTSDHGENLGEANRWEHLFAINDHLLHVPLMIRYPRLFPPGRRIAGQCQLVDIVPTIYDVLGLPAPIADLPGRTLVPKHFIPRGATFAQWSPFYFSIGRLSTIIDRNRDVTEFTAHWRVIRTDRYKYVWSSDGRNRLYDLSQDPDEAVNIIEHRPKVAKSLHKRLVIWWQQQPPYIAREQTSSQPRMSPVELEHLRSLGYIH